MAAFNKFNSFVEALAEKKHDLGADTLKVLLTNSAPIATNTVKADLTEITAANGYTAGGATASITSSSQTSGTYKLVLGDPATWTAARTSTTRPRTSWKRSSRRRPSSSRTGS